MQVRVAGAPAPQHGCPIAPQAAQSRVAPGMAAGAQNRPAPPQVGAAPVGDGQHASPTALPHAAHIPASTAVSPVHTAPA